MKNETFDLLIEKFNGQVLPAPVKGSYSASVYENREEIPDGKRLTDDEYVAAVNAKAKAKERARVSTTLLETAAKAFERDNGADVFNPYAKPDPNDEKVMFEQSVKQTAKLHKITEEQARTLLQGLAAQAAALKG